MTTLRELADEAASCTRCDLYRRATGLVVSTIHPSAVLRTDDQDARQRAYEGLVADLVVARDAFADAR